MSSELKSVKSSKRVVVRKLSFVEQVALAMRDAQRDMRSAGFAR